MAKTSYAQREAVKRYDRENTTALHIKLNKNTDADLIAFLSACDNKQGAVKAALREYMNRPE